jgi:hypothetical protein
VVLGIAAVLSAHPVYAATEECNDAVSAYNSALSDVSGALILRTAAHRERQQDRQAGGGCHALHLSRSGDTLCCVIRARVSLPSALRC